MQIDPLHGFIPVAVFNVTSALPGNKPIFAVQFMFISNTRDFLALNFKMKGILKRWKQIYTF